MEREWFLPGLDQHHKQLLDCDSRNKRMYSTGNMVNHPVITMDAARWILETSGGTL